MHGKLRPDLITVLLAFITAASWVITMTTTITKKLFQLRLWPMITTTSTTSSYGSVLDDDDDEKTVLDDHDDCNNLYLFQLGLAPMTT